MRITYYPEHDALEILLKEDAGATGPGYAEDVSPDGNVTAHFTDAGELISFEVSGDARKLFDLDSISVFNGFDDGDVVLGLHLPLQVRQRAS
jgi:uncharacterized protein YuzE